MKFLIMIIESMKCISSIGYKITTLRGYYTFVLTVSESIDALQFNFFGFLKYYIRHKYVSDLY